MSATLLDQDFGSESEDDNFNPAPADESDNEAGGDSDEGQRSKPTKDGNEQRRPSAEHGGRVTSPGNDPNAEDGDEGDDANGADDQVEDEDEDDEDEDEDEDDAITGRPRKRARRDPRNQYLDVEAEVDEDEEEGDEEDEEGQGEGFIADTHPDDLADLPAGAETDDRRHRELDRQRERAQQMDAEQQAQLYKERYGRSTRTAAMGAAIVPKRALLPGVNDPSIWSVKCKPGKERELVMLITKRIEEWGKGQNPVPIISAFERSHTTGYIYVEARMQSHVFTALDGLSLSYHKSKITLIEVKEMPDLLRVIPSKPLENGSYVRIKKGKYAGDLGQVDDSEPNGNTASVRLVPRLDYGLNEDKTAPAADSSAAPTPMGNNRKRVYSRAFQRPPQRLFSEVEAKKKESRYLESLSTFDKKHWRYRNENFINGFLIKDFKLNQLQMENVDPQLEEVTLFASGAADGTENLDLAALQATLKNNASVESYQPGDVVEVYEGEQQGVVGKISSVRADIASVTITEGDLKGQSIEVPVKGLRKQFKEGDHVKVIGGSRYADEVGMVVRIKNDTVTILSDLSTQEITVFSKDLREASDTGTVGSLGKYHLHDLVQLDPSTVGCIIKVDRETLRILDQNGSVRSVLPSQISNRLERRRHAVATDRHGSEIRIDDTVRELGGDQKKGVILHINRSYLFLYDREQTENLGVSVARASNVATVAAKGGRVAQASNGPDLTKMNPALQRGSANGAGAMPPPRSFGRDRALGQTVTIRKGPHKGLLGIIKDTTDTEARVELHSKSKTITVSKETLKFKDPLTGNDIDYARFTSYGGASRGGYGGGPSGFSSRVPSSRVPQGNRTPLPIPEGGRTPAWGLAAGSRTPAYGSSSARTPAWQQNAMSGGRTPAYGSGGSATVNPYADGSRTQYGGFAGGRTPAWDPSSRTSYGGATNDPFSSRTPAYEPSSRTPAYTSYNNDAHTSYGQSNTTASNDTRNTRTAYDAPTPAAAPTPSATNGNAYSAPTPAAAAATPYGGEVETPYSGQPETPGWGAGETDGPRYEEGTPSP
ncbi:MAG: hypothetical protein Q9191_004932 [Dirinaria sp. TL-2023a]